LNAAARRKRASMAPVQRAHRSLRDFLVDAIGALL
jgi:hypothetical protein